MNLLVLVVDDEPDVELLPFRQHRAGRFTMYFAQSAPLVLQHINDAGDRSLILILSDINSRGCLRCQGREAWTVVRRFGQTPKLCRGSHPNCQNDG